jgi:acyl-CoA synthetase (AMP-forming)/AMP-acid ligase II
VRLVGPPLPAPQFASIPEALAAAATSALGITLVDAREHETFVSYAELLESASRVAGVLIKRGVAQGERVALVLPTGRDFLDAFFGIQLAGAVPVPLYPPVRLGRMDEYVRGTARMLQLVGAVGLLTDRRVKLLLGQAVEQARPRLGAPTVAELLEDGAAPAQRPVSLDDLGVIQFSSGSTVDPKPVALTYRNLMTQCSALKRVLEEQGAHQVGVSWLPLYHDMGLIGCLLMAVYYPGSLVLIPPEVFLAKPAIWLRALSRHRGTISPAPNFAYGLCLKRVSDDELGQVDLSHWSHALNGAEPVSAQTVQRFTERFGAFGFKARAMMPVYGLSEASLAVTFTSASEAVRTLAVDPLVLSSTGEVRAGTRDMVSVGKPIPGAEVEVRDELGVPQAERRSGHVWARAQFVMRSYFGNDDATKKALVDGWLATGDLGFIEGGELFISGRAKDLVIIRGANHAPQEFEECLDAVKGVRTGCAIAVGFLPPGSADEQLLLLVEVVGEPSEALRHLISGAVLEATGIKPHTVELLVPGTLPRTSSGKLRRGLALRGYLEGSLVGPGKVNAITMTKELAKSAVGFAKALLP